MFNLLKEFNCKVAMLVVVSLVISGCQESLTKQYEEVKAATISAYNTTSSVFDDDSNADNSNGQKQATQDSSKPSNSVGVKKKNTVEPDEHGYIQPLLNKLAYKQSQKKPGSQYITIKSPDDSLKSIEYRGYQEKFIRATSSYIQPEIQYMQLLAINDSKKYFNKENLKKLYDGSSFKAKTRKDVIDNGWFQLLNSISPKMLTYPTYKKYMCNEASIKKMVRSNHHNVLISQCQKGFDGGSGSWAGGYGASEFEKRRAFNNYIDKESDKLINMASSASHEIFIQGRAVVSSYMFDDGGFVLNGIAPPGKLTSMKTSLNSDEVAQKYPIFKRIRYARNVRGLLYKMNQSEAEKFAEKIKKNQNYLYYVYKAKLKPHQNSYYYKTKVYNVGQMKYYSEILSEKFEFFFDEAMKNKAFDLPVK